MKMNCDFCLVKADEEEIKKVKETIIDKSPGFISFTALLREIFGVTVSKEKFFEFLKFQAAFLLG